MFIADSGYHCRFPPEHESRRTIGLGGIVYIGLTCSPDEIANCVPRCVGRLVIPRPATMRLLRDARGGSSDGFGSSAAVPFCGGRGGAATALHRHSQRVGYCHLSCLRNTSRQVSGRSKTGRGMKEELRRILLIQGVERGEGLPLSRAFTSV